MNTKTGSWSVSSGSKTLGQSSSNGNGYYAVASVPVADYIAETRFSIQSIQGLSSIIEGAALGVACVNVGPRQDGRERPANVIDAPLPGFGDGAQIEAAIVHGLARPLRPVEHPYGDGRNGGAGARAASVLAEYDPDQHPLLKRNSY